jgi:hypothetical protein
MGAWGHRSFENDDALDWVADLMESDDLEIVESALAAVTDEESDYRESSECSMAVAAAEVVAALNGNAAKSLPKEVKKWLRDRRKPPKALVALARRAVDGIADNSELKELWEETKNFENWTSALDDLRARLS